MRELCINIQGDLPRFMFGNKSAGIVGGTARLLSSRKEKRTSAGLPPPISPLQTERAIRARTERYFVQMQYLWSKQ